LRPGWNRARFELNGAWLPKDVRAAAEQIEWRFSPVNRAAPGWVVVDNLRAERSKR
jgi:hypothetical protein